MSSESDVSLIQSLEDQRYSAVLSKDVKSLQRLLHDELSYVHSSGVSDTKDTYLAGLMDGAWDYKTVQRTDQSIKVRNCLALVSNKLDIALTVHGKPTRVNSRALAVWIKEGEQWQLIALQSGSKS